MNQKQKTFLWLGIVIFIVLSSLILLALLGLQNDISKIELCIIGLGYIFLLILSIVGLDKILWYFLTPKDERGDFWCTNKVYRIQTIDLSKLRTKAEKLKTNLQESLKKLLTKP
jgi:cytochrome c-type biogenesis protein CcmE